MSRRRAPLTRERVLSAAMALADKSGLDAVTMRHLAEILGVEAMSLYKHVAGKDEILDGLVELVVSEMHVPSPRSGWRAGLRARALSAREVLLRHRWAAMLIESRVRPGPARLALNEGVIAILRAAGFSIELAYGAFLTLDSYIYGFVAQEVWWPYEADERSAVIETLRPAISPSQYPRLVEMMTFVSSRKTTYSADFEFGLDLIIDGLDRSLATARKKV